MSVQQPQTVFYIHMPDPMAFLRQQLPKLATKWSGDPDILNEVGSPEVNQGVFSVFYEMGYRQIDISAGLPKNDYGQTVKLFRKGEFREPDLGTLTETGIVPEHLMGPGLPFKPDKMAGTYRHIRQQDERVPDMPIMEERWFFDFCPGYVPKSFCGLSSSLDALRYLSDVMHDLICFTVILMDGGIYVSLLVREHPSRKPPFRMGY
jgi:hypothetical protein